MTIHLSPAQFRNLKQNYMYDFKVETRAEWDITVPLSASKLNGRFTGFFALGCIFTPPRIGSEDVHDWELRVNNFSPHTGGDCGWTLTNINHKP